MYDKESLIKLLTTNEFRAVDENGRPYKPSCDIYNKISHEMDILTVLNVH